MNGILVHNLWRSLRLSIAISVFGLPQFAAMPKEGIKLSDVEVIKLVLSDFVVAMRIPGASGSATVLLVDSETQRASGFLNSNQILGELEPTMIPDSQAMKSLLRRANAGPIMLSALLLADNGIRVVEDFSKQFKESDIGGEPAGKRFFSLFPDAKAYVKLWLPGYSRNGVESIVRFRFGPSPHGAVATYFLGYDHDRWVIRWKKISYLV